MINSESGQGMTDNAGQANDPANEVTPPSGVSPYATGGGGVTFERKVAVQYLAHLLTGGGAPELGDGRHVVSVAFQQETESPVDDLVITAARQGESGPSLLLSLGVRRSPNLVQSNQQTRKLVRDYVSAVINAPTGGPEQRLGLVVAGPQTHAQQLGTLAGLAAVQMDGPGFFNLIETPNQFDNSILGRLSQFEALVGRALRDLGVAELSVDLVRQRTWELLSNLTVLMPRLESPDESDWAAITNNLVAVAKTSDLDGATRLRDRLAFLASEYSPKAARVDLSILRRNAHGALDPKTGRHHQGWQVLDHLHDRALNSVRDDIVTGDGHRRLRIDRSSIAQELTAICAESTALVVTGESGVGKSVLTLRSLASVADDAPELAQVQCINLRHIHKLTVEFEATVGCPLSTLLSEVSAPERMLVVDGADAVAEGWEGAFRYFVDAAFEADLRVIAVTATEAGQVALDILKDRFGTEVAKYVVPPLHDAEIQEIVDTFTELGNVYANTQSRELLRRLVVVDLLVRGGVTELPLSDASAMREIWAGLVRKRESADRGHPDAREVALLRLADLELSGGDRLTVIGGLDGAALAGLRQDGLLQTSGDNPFMIGPDFAHDEVRRYAIARLLLSENTPASKLLNAGVPRWALSAARLASATLLEQPDGPHIPVMGRLSKLQASFDTVVEAGHGVRWGDVPGEALLSMPDCGAVLRDAWPDLKSDDAAGVQRLARLVSQRLRGPNGIINPVSIEPIVCLMLEESEPWRSGEYASNLLKDWLRGHVVTGTSTEHPARIRLRERMMEAYAESNRLLGERLREQAAFHSEQVGGPAQQLEQTHPEWFVSQLDYGMPPRRERPQVPSVCRDRDYIELLALLGPDLGDEGESILQRVAQDAPSSLVPAVEALLTPQALSQYRCGLLAELTEAYYLDDEGNHSHFGTDGIRRHDPRYSGSMGPLAAWYLGPFPVLFQTDPRGGIAVLNRLLNHASLVRARTLARLQAMNPGHQDLNTGMFERELDVSGTPKTYVGDEQVWYWYRGTGVGPYPCISALQALERACHKFIEQGAPINTLITVLLEGCESLAMVGLTMGILVRHFEDAGRSLDSYFADPLVWRLEFARVAQEGSMLSAGSEGIKSAERRTWSLREVATLSALNANDKRAEELRMIGNSLVERARFMMAQEPVTDANDERADRGESMDTGLAMVIAWASCLDRNSFRFRETPDGLYFQPTPPEAVSQTLRPGNQDAERTSEEMQLSARYLYNRKQAYRDVVEPDLLETDIASARDFLEDPTPFGAQRPWDLPTAISAAALDAHISEHANLSVDALLFAAETVLSVSQGEEYNGLYDVPESYFEGGADRSAARALPLLLAPSAARLRALVYGADGPAAFDQIMASGLRLAQSVVNEVRLHLARGLDNLWSTPCVQDGLCHHQLGWEIAAATMRDCVVGGWDPKTGMRSVVNLDEPYAQSLAKTPANSIQPFRLDVSIRALAPAAMANICVSRSAQDLLMVLLDAQNRALSSHELDELDDRGTHVLVTARALLTLAREGDDTALYEQIDSYADHSIHIGHLLRGLSAAAEETPDRAATARRIWPGVIHYVLDLNDNGHAPFGERSFGDLTLAALIPNPTYSTQYLYPELQGNPILWWDPLALRQAVEAWLVPASGKPTCVDQLVIFLRVLSPDDQARVGLPWMAELVLARPRNIANRTYMLADWLVESRSSADAAGLLDIWQQIVDALVVEGDSHLAPYSE